MHARMLVCSLKVCVIPWMASAVLWRKVIWGGQAVDAISLYLCFSFKVWVSVWDNACFSCTKWGLLTWKLIENQLVKQWSNPSNLIRCDLSAKESQTLMSCNIQVFLHLSFTHRSDANKPIKTWSPGTQTWINAWNKSANRPVCRTAAAWFHHCWLVLADGLD